MKAAPATPPAAPRDLAGRRATVMGLGLFGGGAAVARFLAGQGARVTVTDLRTEAELAPALRELAGLPLRFVLGGHRDEDFTRADLVVANPAVPPASPLLAAARAAGVEVTSETALFLERCPARIAAVTGTQGKSSTCNTLHQLLAGAGLDARLGGNIGRSLLEDAERMSPDEVVVLEMSSYQLEVLPERLRGRDGPPRVAAVCVTNVLADHLDRHGTIAAYAAAKRRILELAAPVGGCAVLSAEDPWTSAWSAPGVRRIDAFPTRRSDSGLNLHAGAFRLHREALGRVEDLRLAGRFQRENTLLALGLARILGAEPEWLARALGAVTALPHRMQDLGLVRGHRVWDNGVSTTPDSTIGVLDSLREGFTLIVGGKHKDLPLGDLVLAARGRVRRVVAFGRSAEVHAEAFRGGGIPVTVTGTVAQALDAAFEGLGPDEEILFSPACASYDQYLNFRERALDFQRAVAALREPCAAGTAAPARRAPGTGL